MTPTSHNFAAINNMAIIDKIRLIENQIPNYTFTKNIINSQILIVLLPQDIAEYGHNIKSKLIEGAFITTVYIIGNLDFAHGFFHYCMAIKETEHDPCIILVNADDKLIDLSKQHFKIWTIETYYKEELAILELEHLFNNLTLNIIRERNINQLSWPGKNIQHSIYELQM